VSHAYSKYDITILVSSDNISTIKFINKKMERNMKLKKIAALSLSGLAFMSTSSFANINNVNAIPTAQNANFQYNPSNDFIGTISKVVFAEGEGKPFSYPWGMISGGLTSIGLGFLTSILFPTPNDPTQEKLDNIQKTLEQLKGQIIDIKAISTATLDSVIEMSSRENTRDLLQAIKIMNEMPLEVLEQNKNFYPEINSNADRSIYPFPRQNDKEIYEYADSLYSGRLNIKDADIVTFLRNAFGNNVEVADSQNGLMSSTTSDLNDLYIKLKKVPTNIDNWNIFLNAYNNMLNKLAGPDDGYDMMAPFYTANTAYTQINLKYLQSAAALYNMFKVLIALKYTHENDFKKVDTPNITFSNGYDQSIKDLDERFTNDILNKYLDVIKQNPVETQEEFIDNVINAKVIPIDPKTKFIDSGSFKDCHILSLEMPASTGETGYRVGHMTVRCENKISHFDIPYELNADGKITSYISGIHITKNTDPLKPDYISASSEYYQLKNSVANLRNKGWAFRVYFGEVIFESYDTRYCSLRNDLSANLYLSGEVIQSKDKSDPIPASWKTGFGGYYAYPSYYTHWGDTIKGTNDIFFIHTENGHIFSAQTWKPELKMSGTYYENIVMSCLIGDKSCHTDKEGQSLHWEDGTTISSKQILEGKLPYQNGRVITTAYTTADFTDRIILDGHININNTSGNSKAQLGDGQVILTSNNSQYQLVYGKEKGLFYILNREDGSKYSPFNRNGAPVEEVTDVAIDGGNIRLLDSTGGEKFRPSAVDQHPNKTNFIVLKDNGDLVIKRKVGDGYPEYWTADRISL
jgi:hypothetical protein